jgi:hypothetical protein
VKATIDANTNTGTPEAGLFTVARYAKKWIDGRRPLNLATLEDHEARLRRHVLPRIGTMLMEEVRPRHVRGLVHALRAEGKLAPRSIYHVFFTVSQMFRCAVADEIIVATPCVLIKGDLPKKTDKDPSWRATAIYTRGEIEQLIADRRIPEDRRVLYALKALAGLRHGEGAATSTRRRSSSPPTSLFSSFDRGAVTNCGARSSRSRR